MQKPGHWVHHQSLHQALHHSLGGLDHPCLSTTDLADMMIELGYIRDYDPIGRLIWIGLGLRCDQEDSEPMANVAMDIIFDQL